MKEIKKDKGNISFEIPIGNIHEILFVTSRQKFFFLSIHLIHELKNMIPRFTRNMVIYLNGTYIFYVESRRIKFFSSIYTYSARITSSRMFFRVTTSKHE